MQRRARIDIDVLEGESSLSVTGQVADGFEVFVRRLTDPDGVDVLDANDVTNSSFSKTNAVFVSEQATLDWPISDADSPLRPGRYELEMGVVNEALEFVREPITLDVLLKEDADLTRGSLDVALIYTDALDEDEEVVRAVEEASGQWRDLYSQAGIEVNFRVQAAPFDDVGPPAFGDDDRIRDIVAQNPIRTVHLILSEIIDVDDLEVLGIAGDIPGALVPTSRSAIQVSMLMATGGDGVFDDLDVRLLAETMAHETAHYLGLFHPVERTVWNQWDALEDTVRCNNETDCIRQLGDNLMFPFPVCGVGGCTAQNALSDDQRSVLNLATAVD